MPKLLLKHKHGFAILCINLPNNKSYDEPTLFWIEVRFGHNLVRGLLIADGSDNGDKFFFRMRFVGKTATQRLLKSFVRIIMKLEQKLVYIFHVQESLNWLKGHLVSFSSSLCYIIFYYKFRLSTRVFQQYFINAFYHHSLAQMC